MISREAMGLSRWYKFYLQLYLYRLIKKSLVFIKNLQSHFSVRLSTSKGFTLIEVLMVTGILVAIVVALAPRLGGRNHEIKAVIRKMAVLSRDIRNQAKLQNSTFRLVIDMGSDENDPTRSAANDDAPHRFWVEKGPSGLFGQQADDEKKKKDKLSLRERDELISDFQPDTRLMRKPEKLPKGMKFNQVELSSRSEPIRAGRVYIYYLPQGSIEESVIQLSYGDSLKWSLALKGLTGKSEIFDEFVKLEDIRAK